MPPAVGLAVWLVSVAFRAGINTDRSVRAGRGGVPNSRSGWRVYLWLSRLAISIGTHSIAPLQGPWELMAPRFRRHLWMVLTRWSNASRRLTKSGEGCTHLSLGICDGDSKSRVGGMDSFRRYCQLSCGPCTCLRYGKRLVRLCLRPCIPVWIRLLPRVRMRLDQRRA